MIKYLQEFDRHTTNNPLCQTAKLGQLGLHTLEEQASPVHHYLLIWLGHRGP